MEIHLNNWLLDTYILPCTSFVTGWRGFAAAVGNRNVCRLDDTEIFLKAPDVDMALYPFDR